MFVIKAELLKKLCETFFALQQENNTCLRCRLPSWPQTALQVHVVVRLLTTLAPPVHQDRAQFCGSSEANPIWSHNPLSGPLGKKGLGRCCAASPSVSLPAHEWGGSL